MSLRILRSRAKEPVPCSPSVRLSICWSIKLSLSCHYVPFLVLSVGIRHTMSISMRMSESNHHTHSIFFTLALLQSSSYTNQSSTCRYCNVLGKKKQFISHTRGYYFWHLIAVPYFFDFSAHGPHSCTP